MKEGHWTDNIKTPQPEEKKDPIKYKAYHLAKALLSDGSEEYKLEQLIKLFIQSGELAELRADLNGMRDLNYDKNELIKELRAERDNLLVAYKHAISRISELETERDKSFDGSMAMSKEIEEIKSENDRMKNNEDYKELVEEVIRLRLQLKSYLENK